MDLQTHIPSTSRPHPLPDPIGDTVVAHVPEIIPVSAAERETAAIGVPSGAKINLKGRTMEELEALMESIGQPKFRGRQLFLWINQKKESDFAQMTDLAKSFREILIQKFELPKVAPADVQRSDDGTVKYLVQLEDGRKVESVFIPTAGRNTLCISTQVGCKMACAFCATGYQRFTRDLKSWEIVDQLLSLEFPGPVTNIVMMGMGEPFDNWDEVIRALKIFQHPSGPQIGKRHITVSTVGLSPKITEFVQANLGRLAISLHGTTDEQRSSIMPVNRKYPLAELMETCRKAGFDNRDRVTFEYLMIQGINDSEADAYRLIKLVEGIPCKINLLAYNENTFVDFKRPDESVVLNFQRILLDHEITTTYRRSRGRDIAAACGQLHHKHARHVTGGN
jgi:23S rRNA (adenine2503-C2)-methyltransferase